MRGGFCLLILGLSLQIGLLDRANAQQINEGTLTELLGEALAQQEGAWVEVVRTFRVGGFSPPMLGLDRPEAGEVHARIWALEARPTADNLGALLSLRGLDGGYGLEPGYAVSSAVTAEALLSLSAMPNLRSELIEPDVLALVLKQRIDGGWSSGHGLSDLPTTALAVRALGAWRRHFPVNEAINAGVAYLEAQALDAPMGLFEALRCDALASVEALTLARLTALREMSINGRWYDVQGTAAALRAMLESRADLEVVRFIADDPSPPEGETVTLRTELRNRGLEAVGPFEVTLRDGDRVETQLVEGLDAEEALELTWTLETQGRLGGITLRVQLDSAEVIFEPDEENNHASVRVRVQERVAADLSIRADLIDIRPIQPKANTPFEIGATIYNLGNQASTPTDVAFYLGAPDLGGELLGRVPLIAIPGEGQQEISLPIPAGLPSARYRLFVIIEPGGAVDPYLVNNQAARTLRVLSKMDLRIPGGTVTLDPGPILGHGKLLKVRVRVQNNSEAVATPITEVRISEGTLALGSANVPALEAGQGAEVEITIDLPEIRVWRLAAHVDPDDQIVEVNESDNLAPFVVSIEEWVLKALSVRLSSVRDPETGEVLGALHQGMTGVFACGFENRSPLPINGFAVELRDGSINGTVLARVEDLSVLAAPYNGSTPQGLTLDMPTDSLAPGPHTIVLWVDSQKVPDGGRTAEWPSVRTQRARLVVEETGRDAWSGLEDITPLRVAVALSPLLDAQAPLSQLPA